MGEITNDDLREWWRAQGGNFHGPNVETGTMPEAKLLPTLRILLAARQPNPDPSRRLHCNCPSCVCLLDVVEDEHG
jgi:hypothetical protein